MRQVWSYAVTKFESFWVDAHDCGEVYAKDLESYQSRIPLGFYGGCRTTFHEIQEGKTDVFVDEHTHMAPKERPVQSVSPLDL